MTYKNLAMSAALAAVVGGCVAGQGQASTDGLVARAVRQYRSKHIAAVDALSPATDTPAVDFLPRRHIIPMEADRAARSGAVHASLDNRFNSELTNDASAGVSWWGAQATAIEAGPSVHNENALLDSPVSAPPPDEGWWTPGRKVLALNAGVAAAIAGYGAIEWDWGSQSPNFGKEGWFGSDTSYGGADKLGHAWAFYVLASLYTNLFEYWGYDRDKAAAYAALSSWTQGLLLELGDGFSRDHGFSTEDLAANTAGIVLAYFRQRYPRLRETVDFRFQWIPTRQFRSGERRCLFTDYSGHKYLLAFKVGNIVQSESPALQALELQTGYYTRGFTGGDRGPEKRYGYIGVGLNVTYLLTETIKHNAYNIFDYVQVPYTYLPAKYSFD